MRRPERQAERPHLLLYDGECGFCDGVVRFVLARDRRGAFHFAALQSGVAAVQLAPFGGRPPDLATFYVIENYRGSRPVLRSRADGVFLVAKSLGWPWNSVAALRLLPRQWLDAAYDVLARHRRRIFGPSETCHMPQPGDRDRFLDTHGGSTP